MSGWIFELEGRLVHKNSESYEDFDSIMTYKETTLYKDSKCTIPLITLDAGLVISRAGNDSCFYGVDRWNNWNIYLKYNNYAGFVEFNDIVCSFEEEFMMNYEAKMYEKRDINSNIIQDIPNGTTIKSIFEDYEEILTGWKYIEYNGKKGWVFYSEDINLYGPQNYRNDLLNQDELVTTNEIENNIYENNITEDNFVKEANQIQKDKTLENNSNSNFNINIIFSIVILVLVIVIIIFINKNNKLIKKYNEKK